MKIAIHHSQNSFSGHWIKNCEDENIPYKIVNCFDSDIIKQLEDCDGLMWHHHHGDYKAIQLAKPLLFSLEQAGIKVFPSFNTGWHFDNKLAQKYLLEVFGAPLVKSYVFYSKKEALDWSEKTSYPKVFKLKGGAGAQNVKLVKSKKEAIKLINKSFGKGWPAFDKANHFREKISNFSQGKESSLAIWKAFGRLIIPVENINFMPIEKGYAYFQEFIPNNKTDFRIKVVDGKCWGFQRKVRVNDFRASGSGELVFDNSQIPLEMIKVALETSKNLGLQSVAFDFIIDSQNKPLIVEMSYGFGHDDGELENGYWDNKLNWHNTNFDPYSWMVKNLIKDIHSS